MGIFDTHADVIREILKTMNRYQEEYHKLLRSDKVHDKEWELDTTYDDAMINGLKDALSLFLGNDALINLDDDYVWRIYLRWE